MLHPAAVLEMDPGSFRSWLRGGEKGGEGSLSPLYVAQWLDWGFRACCGMGAPLFFPPFPLQPAAPGCPPAPGVINGPWELIPGQLGVQEPPCHLGRAALFHLVIYRVCPLSYIPHQAGYGTGAQQCSTHLSGTVVSPASAL